MVEQHDSHVRLRDEHDRVVRLDVEVPCYHVMTVDHGQGDASVTMIWIAEGEGLRLLKVIDHELGAV
jgi:hypothetical protein